MIIYELIENFPKYDILYFKLLIIFIMKKKEVGIALEDIFYKSPDKLVKRLITQKMLKFLKQKKWEINYPYHKLPEKRKDILLNEIVLIVTLILAIGFLINVM